MFVVHAGVCSLQSVSHVCVGKVYARFEGCLSGFVVLHRAQESNSC